MKIWQVIPALHEQPPELFEPETRALIESALQFGAVDYVRASAGLRRLPAGSWRSSRRLRPAADVDARAAARADRGARGRRSWVQFANAGRFTPFTQVANITGLPAVSLPLSWNDDGLPIGVQFVGRPAEEATLVRISAQLEQARPWRDRRPPVS
jgi:Asp-tRNA(Asn)/Glu-tRNA(Gln) amidotransferase A subunit family amidase